MKTRENEYFSLMINQSLIMNKLKGRKEACLILCRANLPDDLIVRVLKQKSIIRSTDYH